MDLCRFPTNRRRFEWNKFPKLFRGLVHCVPHACFIRLGVMDAQVTELIN